MLTAALVLTLPQKHPFFQNVFVTSTLYDSSTSLVSCHVQTSGGYGNQCLLFGAAIPNRVCIDSLLGITLKLMQFIQIIYHH